MTKRLNPVKKDRHFVTALDRGLQVLRCFSLDESELTVSEIARKANLPQSTVWRLCHTLTVAGFLVPSGTSGRVALGIPVLALGYAVLCRQSLAKIALPYMQSLTERLKMGTSIAVRDGLYMVYLQRTHGDFVYMNDPVGARRPVATAPTAWACLAAYDDVQRSNVMSELKRADPEAWRITERHISTAIDDYRRTGYICSIGIMHEHFNAVAVPIRMVGSAHVYGLSASGLASLWPADRLAKVGQELISLANDLRITPDLSNPY